MRVLPSEKAVAVIVAGVLLASTVGTGVGVGESTTGPEAGVSDESAAESSIEQETPPEQDNSTDRDTRRRYESIVIFRNDDVQPYYRTEAQRKVDRIFVEEQVPVTQAVIPAPRNEEVVPNQRFCEYLTRQKQRHPEIFEYALHGYNHKPETEFVIVSTRHYSGHAKSEFVGSSVREQREKIERGTRALEACVGEKPEVFVPPFGTYSAKTVEILVQQGYDAMSEGGWYTEYYHNTSHEEFPLSANGLLHVPRTSGFVANWTTGEFASLDSLKYRFDRAYEDNGLYVQMLHSPQFTDEQKRQQLREFIDYVDSHEGVKFMTVGEFARSYESGRLERVENGWLYEPPESSAGESSDEESGDGESSAEESDEESSAGESETE